MDRLVDELAKQFDLDPEEVRAGLEDGLEPYAAARRETRAQMAEATAALPGEYDEPVYHDTATAPVFLCTATSPLDTDRPGGIRDPWGTRLSTLAAPVVMDHGDITTGPVANWFGPALAVEGYERLKSDHEVGEAYDRAAVYATGGAWREMDADLRDHLVGDAETVAVNPPRVRRQTRKDETARIAEREDVPRLPTVPASVMFDSSAPDPERLFGTPDRVVTKPIGGSRGEGVERHDGIDAAHEALDRRRASHDPLDPDRYLLQPYVDHRADVRVIVAGGEVIGGERRVRGDDHRANLSLVPDAVDAPYVEELGEVGKAFNAYENGRAEPLTPEEIPSGAHTVVRETLDAIEDDQDVDGPAFFGAVDVLDLTPEGVEDLPEPYRERVETASGHALMEVQQGPGAIVEHLHYWRGTGHADPTLGLAQYLYDCAGVEIDREAVAGDEESQLWRRIAAYREDLVEHEGRQVPETVAEQETVRNRFV